MLRCRTILTLETVKPANKKTWFSSISLTYTICFYTGWFPFQISVREGEDLLLLDNSKTNMWKVNDDTFLVSSAACHVSI